MYNLQRDNSNAVNSFIVLVPDRIWLNLDKRYLPGQKMSTFFILIISPIGVLGTLIQETSGNALSETEKEIGEFIRDYERSTVC